MPLAQPITVPSSRNRLRRWLPLTALFFLIAAGMLEASLRLLLGLGNPILITPDPECGYIVKPDQDKFRFFVHTSINHFGMRSDQIATRPDPHTLRLMFVGDSITFGTTRVDQSQIFTQIVQRELPRIVQRPVEILNASANAWAPDNEVAYVRSRGIFQSDAVILVLNDGDLTQPRATIDQVGGELVTRPPLALDELWAKLAMPRIRHAFHAPEKSDAGDTIDPNASTVLQQNLADLTGLNRLVSSHHVRLIVIYIPFRADIPAVSGRCLAPLRSWAAAHQVPLLDMTSVEASHSPREININGGHLNAYGNLLIARALEQSLPRYLQN